SLWFIDLTIKENEERTLNNLFYKIKVNCNDTNLYASNDLKCDAEFFEFAVEISEIIRDLWHGIKDDNTRQNEGTKELKLLSPLFLALTNGIPETIQKWQADLLLKTMQKLFNKTKGKDKSRGCKSDHCLFVGMLGLCLEILFSETSTKTFSEDDLLEKINEDCNKLLRFGRVVIAKIRKEVVIKIKFTLKIWRKIRTCKPKNARSKRALKKREPKVEENVKKAMFLKTIQTSQTVRDALKDLYCLKKPDGINFSKKNHILPFEDETSLEFFSQKNDCSLFVVGSHTKKRPDNLVFVRMYDGQVLDMVEVGIENAIPMSSFKTSKCAIGMKPLFIFNGDLFDTSTTHQTFKNMLLDFFRGQKSDSIALSGLDHIISVSAVETTTNDGKVGKIYFRVYKIHTEKSGQKIPRVELEEMGPSYDFVIRRTKFAKEEVYKAAIKIPRELKPRKKKNIDVNELNDKVARIHLGKQDFNKIQTRKMKGLKRSLKMDDSGDDDNSDKEVNDVDVKDEKEVYKAAIKIPRELKPRKKKNIDVNELNDKVARIHLGKQDFNKIQTRKMKGLKRSLKMDDSGDDDNSDKEVNDVDVKDEKVDLTIKKQKIN
ncbi:2191_t:CDS:2, partial [Entrophospora sp. SA101]